MSNRLPSMFYIPINANIMAIVAFIIILYNR